MLESNLDIRAKFKSESAQKLWFKRLKLHADISTIALLCSYSERTIRDWSNGKFNPNLSCVKKICSVYHLPIPQVYEIARFEHLYNAGKKGGLQTIAKYGRVPVNEVERKKKWQTWWNAKGQYDSKLPTQAIIVTHPKKNTFLAEFIGILIGDGSLSKYQIGVTLHSEDDLAYSQHVTSLISKLFKIQPKIYTRKNKRAIVIVVARKLLVNYLHTLGLPIGNKIDQCIGVPTWILKNKQFSRACLRGLMDTDGSVFIHKYKSKNKVYAYKKISFTSASSRLRNDVFGILRQNHIKACITGNNVRIDSRSSYKTYVQLVGSSNPKHLKMMRD
jgi:DNA-binding XRE family transcriptional regulator